MDFPGEKRLNERHYSTTDAEALLARKGAGKEAKLSYGGHLLMESRNEPVVDSEVLLASNNVERDAAPPVIEGVSGDHRIALGSDQDYDTTG